MTLTIGQWCITGLSLIVLFTILFSLMFPQKADAQTEDGIVYYKYYQNITIEKGDSLWDYAKTYKSPDIDISDYIREVKFINQIEDDKLVAGRSITIPYYSPEYICSGN